MITVQDKMLFPFTILLSQIKKIQTLSNIFQLKLIKTIYRDNIGRVDGNTLGLTNKDIINYSYLIE